MFQAMFKMMQAISSGRPPIIARTAVGGCVVSTVNTTDCGPETAILAKNGSFPVERYETKEEALLGHNRWIEHMKDQPSTVKEIGYPGFCDDDEEFIVYFSNDEAKEVEAV